MRQPDVSAADVMDAIAEYLGVSRYHLESALQELVSKYEKDRGIK